MNCEPDDLDTLFGGAPPSHDAHVLLFLGFDRSAAGLWHAEIRACPFCVPHERTIEPCLSHEEIWNGTRLIHYVVCGGCGTCGPWANSESEAIALWGARA
jgi:hypothetical protein